MIFIRLYQISSFAKAKERKTCAVVTFTRNTSGAGGLRDVS